MKSKNIFFVELLETILGVAIVELHERQLGKTKNLNI